MRHVPKEAGECGLLLDRLRLAAGTLPERSPLPADSSHDSLMRAAIHARGYVLAGDVRRAGDLAVTSLRAAREQGYPGIQIWNLVTLGAIAAKRGNVQRAGTLATAAWSLLLQTGDYGIAADAFCDTDRAPGMLGPVLLGNSFTSMLADAVRAAFPSSPLAYLPSANRTFAAALHEIVLGSEPRPEALRHALRVAQISAPLFRRQQQSIATTLAHFLAAPLPLDRRAHFAAATGRSISDLFNAVACALGGQAAESA